MMAPYLMFMDLDGNYSPQLSLGPSCQSEKKIFQTLRMVTIPLLGQSQVVPVNRNPITLISIYWAAVYRIACGYTNILKTFSPRLFVFVVFFDKNVTKGVLFPSLKGSGLWYTKKSQVLFFLLT